jgi:hypothetical protein
VRQEAELAEVDAEHWHLAQRAGGAHYGAVATDHHLHVGLRRILGEGVALDQPRPHLVGEGDRLWLTRVGAHAQAAQLRRFGTSPIARLAHRRIVWTVGGV